MKEYKNYYDCLMIADGLWKLCGADGTNCYLSAGRDSALLVDTAYGYGDLRAAAEKITDKPLRVFCTHGHMDHCLGNYQFGDCEIYMNRRDWELAKSSAQKDCKEKLLEHAHHYMNYVTMQGGDIIPTDFPCESYLDAGIGELSDVNEGDRFDLGGVCWEVYAFPGHTRGSMGLYDPQTGILLQGDAYGPSPWMFGHESAKLPDFIRGLRTAVGLKPAVIWGGHGTEPIPVEILSQVLECALHLDYNLGEEFRSPMFPGIEARSCRNTSDPEGICIVISKENL